MLPTSRTVLAALSATAALLAAGCSPSDDADGKLSVVASTPDGGSIVEAVAGDRVSVTTLADGASDPHRVESTPQMIVDLRDADLLVVIGQGLEDNWLDELVDSSKNKGIAEGAEGYVELDAGIDIVSEEHHHHDHFDADAMAASLHPEGDPHYLLDPINGVRAAATVRDALTEADPDGADAYAAGYDAFAKELLTVLVGEEAVAAHAVEELVEAIDHGELAELLGEAEPAGVLAALAPFAGTPYACDHDQWGYLADRYGLVNVAMLEQIPGVEPSAAHLSAVVAEMRETGARLILTVPYFDERAAASVAGETDAEVVALAHQVQGLPEATGFVETVRLNAERLIAALSETAAVVPAGE